MLKMEQRTCSLPLMAMMAMTMTMAIMMMMMQPAVGSVPVIHAPWGTLQGISMQGDAGRKMNAYRGIPYAKPPVGPLRFEKPQPHPGPANGEVFVADKIMPPCPQKPLLIGSRETSEDCLMLDVYVPADPDSSGTAEPYAVMVWIHGGGFTMGDADTYRPSKLVVDGNVIVVVIQYRVGVLGFLTSGDDALKENLGLWDQTLSLRWVKENIQAFGGDPGRITIFGESAGGMSVGFHLVMPESQGLFQRAIMQSGSPLDVVGFIDYFDKKTVFKGLTDQLGCKGGNSGELVECLRQMPLDHLITTATLYELSSPMMNYFFPVVDGDLVPRAPRELLQDRTLMENGANNVDVMVGFNKDEGALILITQILGQLPPEVLYTADFFDSIVDLCLAFNGRHQHPVLKETTKFYYRGAEAIHSVSSSLDPLVNMYGDCLITAIIVEMARYLSPTAAATTTTAPRYLYVLDHHLATNDQGSIPGAHHGDDILLLFDMDRQLPEDSLFHVLNKTFVSEEEKRGISRKMVDVWTAFAKTGNPSGPLKDDLQGGEWLPFTRDEQHYLSLSSSPRMVSDLGPYRDRMALWLDLLPKLDALVSQMLPPAAVAGEQDQSPPPPSAAAREDL